MKVEKEMKYEAPEVEILEVEVEVGFDASALPGTGGSATAPGIDPGDWE